MRIILKLNLIVFTVDLLITILLTSCKLESDKKNMESRNEIKKVQFYLELDHKKLKLQAKKGYFDEDNYKYQLQNIDLSLDSEYRIKGKDLSLELEPLSLTINSSILTNKSFNLEAKKINLNNKKTVIQNLKLHNTNFKLEAKDGLSDSSFKLIRLHKVKAVFK